MDGLGCVRRSGCQPRGRSIDLGGPDYRAFYTATGYVTMIGQGLLVIWFAVAGVSMIVGEAGDRALDFW